MFRKGNSKSSGNGNGAASSTSDNEAQMRRLYGDDSEAGAPTRRTQSVEPPSSSRYDDGVSTSRFGYATDDEASSSGGRRSPRSKKKKTNRKKTKSSGEFGTGAFANFFQSKNRSGAITNGSGGGGGSSANTSMESSRGFGGGGGGAAASASSSAASTTKSKYSTTLAAVSDIERLAQKKGHNPADETFKVLPDDSYPNTYMNREQLREEMNQTSYYFHDLRVPSQRGRELGQLRVEVLQCFGLPTASMLRETQAYCMAVVGSFAFKTDVMPPVANPMWLSKMRRACLFPLSKAYARVYLGVFDQGGAENQSASDFIGRVVIDVARLRPGCSYDITLPLRQSAHVFSRIQQGAIRIRLHLLWQSEQAAILSYIPRKKPKSAPNLSQTINCLDPQSFRNVAHCVHGAHMPGKFSMTLLKATIREVNFTRIHLMRYIRRRELYNLMYWVYPFISGFVFLAWMHAVRANSVRYLPGHVVLFLLLHLYKNYAYYGMDSILQNGFLAPTFEELLAALLQGTRRRRYIEPLQMEVDESHAVNPMDYIQAGMQDEDYEEANTGAVPIFEIAESMRKSLPVMKHKYRLKTYRNCFLGSDAVDFLVSFGFAYSRAEAVALGRKLQKEVRLLEHVGKKYGFEDEAYYYQFLDYDTRKYIIKGHQPRGKSLMKAIGFLPHDTAEGGGGGLMESQGHVEFPFAQGDDIPRFSVKQSLVIRSAEAKKMLKEQEQALETIEIAEFGVDPGDVPEPTTKKTFKEDFDDAQGETNAVRRTVRRASITASAAVQVAVNLPNTVRNAPGAVVNTVMNAPTAMGFTRTSVEVADPSEIYGKLRDRQNPTLDELLEEQQNANTYDEFAYDSDDDVADVKCSKSSSKFIWEEKILKPPPNQDFSMKKRGGDKSFTKSITEARHKVHGLLFHVFNDHVYKIDPNLFPTKGAADDSDLNTIQKKEAAKKKKPKRLLMGGGGARNAAADVKEDERKKKAELTPYDKKQDELDKVLQINKYSHANPWINRVAVIIQPLVEIVQVGLFLCRATFNVFTWQDPILSFWAAFLGPFVVLILYLAPYRLLFGVLGIALVGPQNWVLRRLRESRADYEPPDFNKISKKKRKPEEERYDEVQFFSSQAPGNQLVKFKNVDPKQVRKVVVPDSIFKHSRFYDWPPEPEYARVYASSAPRNTNNHGAEDGGGDDVSDSFSDDAFWFDPTQVKKKKKKKKGLKKVAHHAKKGAGVIVHGGLDVGGAVLDRTMNTTMGVAKGATKLTKNAVNNAGNVVKGTADVVKGTAEKTVWGMRQGMKKKKGGYDYDDGE